jgi:hypothetical protein
MWSAASYFDESADEAQGYAVGGFMGHQLDCVHLDWIWREKILKKYNLAYFKASELEGGFGEFAQYRDNPKDLKARFSPREAALFREIKTKTIDIFLGAEFITGFGAVVLLPDYARLKQEMTRDGLALPSPYFFCAQLCMMEAGFMMDYVNKGLEQYRKGCVRPVFDNHEEYRGRARQMFDQFQKKNPICSKWLLAPRFADDKDYVVLQVADNLAYEVRKLVIGEEYAPERPERIAMTRLKERMWKVYKLTYQSMKLIMRSPKNSIPIEPEIYNPSNRMEAGVRWTIV